MTRQILCVLVAVLLLWLGASCGKKPAAEDLTQEVSLLKQEVTQLKEEVARLRAENEALKISAGKSGSEFPGHRSEPPAQAVGHVEPQAEQSGPPGGGISKPSSEPAGDVRFSDIQGIFAEKAIAQMALLAIFDQPGGKFRPHEPIMRREFVRWLVKANNAYFQDVPDKQIRLAETPDATFSDVPSGDPDFKYIQGIANAGFVIGYDATHFKPDRPLTREEMVAIKAGRDRPTMDKNIPLYFVRDIWGFTDVEKISKQYYAAIYSDHFTKNIKRVYGSLKTFNPQKPVTRAEAALCLEVIEYSGSAAKALKGK